ncbi:MAG TPA: DUF1223 domain-containing protein [Xanthobacteraceae bacterium]|nr:DUF1223 domain-containing protein [Xanthobacteraceae bacterium]
MLRRRRGPKTAAALFVMTGVVLASAGLARAGEPRALLELFTSQGCSSCPPADKLLGELSADPSLVVMSVPIDYWDYLGWKDTLANPAHSARQRAYSRIRGDRQVYTPQVVINGAAHALGSDRAAIERAVALTDQKAGVMSLPVALAKGNTNLDVQVESAENEHANAEVWLCPLSKTVSVEISRGENHGHTMIYHNVVRGWIKLGDWTGTKASWHVPTAQIAADGADAAAVVVQEGTHDKPGIILGAAYLPLQ